MNDYVATIGLSDYAARHQVSERTVKRWLASEALPGAVKVEGTWSIPADAKPLRGAGGGGGTVITQQPLMPSAPARPSAPATTPATPAPAQGHQGVPWGALDQLPALVPLELAARFLGVTPSQVHALARRELVELIELGNRHDHYVPQRSLRGLAGI